MLQNSGWRLDYPTSPTMKQLSVFLAHRHSHSRIPCSSILPLPLYTTGWRQTTWTDMSSPRKQHHDKAIPQTSSLSPLTPQHHFATTSVQGAGTI